MIRRALSVEFKDAVRISNDPRYLTGIVPAGNIISTANEASRFMQLLLGGGTLGGVQVFEPRTLVRAVAETSYLEVDLTLGLPVRYSMGFMLGGRYASVYGTHTDPCSDSTTFIFGKRVKKLWKMSAAVSSITGRSPQ